MSDRSGLETGWNDGHSVCDQRGLGTEGFGEHMEEGDAGQQKEYQTNQACQAVDNDIFSAVYFSMHKYLTICWPKTCGSVHFL